MAKSFEKIRCVHKTKNTLHLIPEHLLTDEYLEENELIIQGKPVTKEAVIKEPIKKDEEVAEEKLVKAPKQKATLVNK